MNVTIIGDGAMPTVSAMLLRDNGHAVRIWGFFPERIDQLARDLENTHYLPGVPIDPQVEFTANPAEAFAEANLVLSAVPTIYLRGTWQRLAEHCPRDLPIVSATKGIENDSLLRPTQIIREVLWGEPDADAPVAVLSGPNIAHEIARRMPATSVVAAASAALAETAQSALSTGYFRVYTNPDLVGVELAGAVKNVVAIAAGILDGLGAGDNAKAALLTRGLVEIARLGVAMGARRETYAGLAGLGDLVTTCISPYGRNRNFGEAIGKGRSAEQAQAATESVVEGVNTARSVRALAERLNVEMPITEAVCRVIFEGQAPSEAVTDLMTRSPKGEDEEWA